MKMSKKLSLIVSSTLAISVILSGCTKNKEETKPPETAQQESDKQDSDKVAQNAESVNKFFNNYYNAWITNSETSVEDSIKVDEVFMEALGPEKYSEMSNLEDPSKLFKDLDKKKTKEVADKLQEINKSSKFYDFRKSSDKDRAYINLTSITYSRMLQGATGSTIKVEVPQEAVEIKENSTVINASDIIFELDGNRLPNVEESSGIDSTKLNFVDNEWKIDAVDMMKQVDKKVKDSKK